LLVFSMLWSNFPRGTRPPFDTFVTLSPPADACSMAVRIASSNGRQ